MDIFARKIQEVSEQVEQLTRVAEGAPLKPLFEQALTQLQVALEELHVAEDELRQQNEELITSRELLETERRRYSDLFDLAPDPYLITDMNGIVRQANQAALLRFHIPGKKLLGIPLSNRIEQSGRRDFRSLLIYMAGIDTPQEVELRFEAGFTQVARVVKQRDTSGKPVNYLWLMRNISARQIALESSEERYRIMVEAITDYAIIRIDPDGRIASWNSGAQRIIGYNAEEVIGKPGSIIFTPEDIRHGAPQQEIDKAARDGRAEDERWHVRKDHTRFWGAGVMMALPDYKNNGFVKFMRDRTMEKLAGEERTKSRERIAVQESESAVLEERNRLAREIHDTLAQGFTGIAIQLEAAEDSLAESAEDAKKHLAKARILARQSLLAARRSVQALRPEGLYGGSLPSALEHLVEYAATDNATSVQFKLEGTPFTLPDDVEVNLLRISQEALTNTLKHAEAANITVQLAFGNNNVRLSVKDDGQGFAPHVAISTTGYGLMSMRERAARIAGNFKISSQPGQGTEVEVFADFTAPPPERSLP